MPDSPVIDFPDLTTPIYSDIVYAIDDPDGTPVDSRLELWRLVQAGADLPNATATTGASQAGRSITVGASDAVASTDTAGAAAGGTVTIVGGAAARNTSGNANGGNVLVTPGAGIGTGTAGKLLVRQPGGTPGTHEGLLFHDGVGFVIQRGSTSGNYIKLDISGTTNSYVNVNDNIAITANIGNHEVRIWGSRVKVGSADEFGWASGVNPDNSIDCGFKRITAGVIGSATTPTWVQNTPGSAFLASAFTDATGTLANVTGLTVTLKAGRKYHGTLTLFLSTDQAAEGVKLDFDGGTATMTAFSAGIVSNVQGATLGVTVSSAIATDLTATALSGNGLHVIVVSFSCVVNAGGTFIPRLAQNSHTSGTLTAAIGTCMQIDDMV